MHDFWRWSTGSHSSHINRFGQMKNWTVGSNSPNSQHAEMRDERSALNPQFLWVNKGALCGPTTWSYPVGIIDWGSIIIWHLWIKAISISYQDCRVHAYHRVKLIIGSRQLLHCQFTHVYMNYHK